MSEASVGSQLDGDRSNFSRTFKYLMAAQLFSRIITYAFNTWVLRQLTKEEFANVMDFDLITIFALVIIREGFQRACIRDNISCSCLSEGERAAKLLKITWVIFPFGVVATIAACLVIFCSQALSYSDPCAKAILIYGCACLLELLAEPLHIFFKNLHFLKLRLIVETAATFFRCLTTYILIVKQTGMEKGIVLAISQVAYGACLFFGYLGYFFYCQFKNSGLFPLRVGSMMDYDGKLLVMCMWFSFLKCIFQRGEKMVLLWFLTPHSKAAYGFVDRLGSLVVRLVFSPFEEISYATFARGASGKDPQKGIWLGSSLTEALKLVLLVGFVVMTFGPSYSYSLIRMYDRRWIDGEAPKALQYYCLYVFLLAVNGTVEAFMYSVATEEQLQRANVLSFIFSMIYLGQNTLLRQSAGAVGLVVANSLTITLRIAYSINFINRYFQGSPLFSFLSCLPSGWTYLLLSGVITRISERKFLDPENFRQTFFIHFSIGLTCFCMSSVVIYRRERPLINKIIGFHDHSD
eukprot:XP_010665491.1 PREDICTED: protein RFT1 homolog isoform X2 [Vitis vinifera]